MRNGKDGGLYGPVNINHVLVESFPDLQGMADKKCERLGMGMGEIGLLQEATGYLSAIV